MRLILIILAFSGSLSFAQDTIIYGDHPIDTSKKVVLESLDLFMADCAHGHMCCAVGCSCCRELSRPQVYDTVIYSLQNGGKRVEVFERYTYAAMHAPSRIQYLFKDEKGDLINSYYSSKYTSWFGGYYIERYHPNEDSIQTEFINKEVAVFDSNRRYFIINANGEVVPPTYHSKEKLAQNLYRASVFLGRNRYYTFLDDNNQELGDGLIFTRIGEMTEDGTFICQEAHSKFSLRNKKGESILKTDQGAIKVLGKGLYSVQTTSGYALYNLSGEKLSDYYEDMGQLSDGMISFRIKQKMGFINEKGQLLIKPSLEWAYPFSNDLAAVVKDKKWGFINKKGEQVIDYQFDLVRPFSNDRAAVAVGTNSNKDKWGVIDTKGKFIVDPIYDELYGYKDGLCKTNINGSGYGFIDVKGKEKLAPKFFIESYGTDSSWFRYGVAVLRTVGSNGRLFLINQDCKEVLGLSDYYSARYVQLSNRLVWLPYLIVQNKENKSGLIDFKGNEIIKAEWEQIYVLNAEVALVSKNDKWFVFDYIKQEKNFLMEGKLNQMPTHEVIILENEEKELRYFSTGGIEFKPY